MKASPSSSSKFRVGSIIIILIFMGGLIPLYQSCGQYTPVGLSSDSGGGGNGNNLPNTFASPQLQLDALSILQRDCAGCHGGNKSVGGITGILSPPDISRQGLVDQRNPANSAIFDSIDNESMPPGNPMSAADKEVIREWIQQGIIEDDPGIQPLPIEPTFTSLYANVFVASCNVCHGATLPALGISYANHAATLATVTVATPAASPVYDSIAGLRMPQASLRVDTVDAAEQDALLQWITAGAPNN